MNIKIVRPQGHLSESGQGNPVAKFATINEKGETTSPFFQCRDYISDLLWSHYCKKPINVHGFVSDGKEYENIMEDGKFRLVLKVHYGGQVKPITPEQYQGVKSLIEMFDASLSFPPSEVTLSDDEKYIIICVDKVWTEVPYLQSTLLLLMRLGLKYDPNQPFIEYFSDGSASKYISPYDASYFRASKHILERLLKGEIDSTQKYVATDGIYSVHGNYGIYAYGSRHK